MKTPLSFILLFTLLIHKVCAQETDTIQSKNLTLIGINVTNTLAGFFNSGGQNVPKDPFLFSFKTLKNNKLLRFGVNFKVDTKNETVQSGFDRKVKETEFLLRIGREWERPINKRFALFYGFDVVGNYLGNNSEADFFGNLKSKETTVGAGIGPFLGVYLLLGDRVRLSTETYAYAMFYAGESSTDIGQGVPQDKTSIRRFTVLPAVPNSLYLHFSF